MSSNPSPFEAVRADLESVAMEIQSDDYHSRLVLERLRGKIQGAELLLSCCGPVVRWLMHSAVEHFELQFLVQVHHLDRVRLRRHGYRG